MAISTTKAGPQRHRAPLVSVIIPTHNRSDLVADAIDSVLEQGYNSIEIIVIDDGSTDNTEQVVSAFGGRVRYVFQQNRGPAAARNAGIECANGEFVALLDSDDYWLAGKLTKQMTVFEKEPSLDLVFGLERAVDKAGNPLGVPPPRAREWRLRRLPVRFPAYACEGDLVKGLISCAHVIGHGSVVLRRSSVQAIGGYDEHLQICEDFDLWLRFALAGRSLGFVDDVVYCTRRHGPQLTAQPVALLNARIHVILKALGDERFPDSAKGQADYTIAGHCKTVGDYLFARGRTRDARGWYLRAMKHCWRLGQCAAWLCTLLGRFGRIAVAYLNRGSDIFRTDRYRQTE